MKQNKKRLICTAIAESFTVARLGSISAVIFSVATPLLTILLTLTLSLAIPFSSYCGLAAIGVVLVGCFFWKLFFELPRRQETAHDLPISVLQEQVSEHSGQLDGLRADVGDLRSTLELVLLQHPDAAIWHSPSADANTATSGPSLN